jgi:hypothetical protein
VYDAARGMAILRAAWRCLMAAAAISCLAAVVVRSGEGGGATPFVLLQQAERGEGGGEKRGYLGDHEALSADAARREANSYFDGEIHTALKLKAQHNLRRKGMDAVKARNDLNDFFNTLGLTKSHQRRTQVDVHEKRVVNHNTKKQATTVNVYINEDTKQKKAALKAHALAKKIKEAKAASRPAKDYGKEDGLPLPLALQPNKARQQALVAKPVSKFDQEMQEAKSLLKSSKIERALSQARTLSLKADAPYYTSR